MYSLGESQRLWMVNRQRQMGRKIRRENPGGSIGLGRTSGTVKTSGFKPNCAPRINLLAKLGWANRANKVPNRNTLIIIVYKPILVGVLDKLTACIRIG